jgi:hypothetical protein
MGREKAQRDLRPIAVEGLPDKVACVIHYAHDRATSSIAYLAHVTAINPQMALTNAFRTTR